MPESYGAGEIVIGVRANLNGIKRDLVTLERDLNKFEKAASQTFLQAMTFGLNCEAVFTEFSGDEEKAPDLERRHDRTCPPRDSFDARRDDRAAPDRREFAGISIFRLETFANSWTNAVLALTAATGEQTDRLLLMADRWRLILDRLDRFLGSIGGSGRETEISTRRDIDHWDPGSEYRSNKCATLGGDNFRAQSTAHARKRCTGKNQALDIQGAEIEQEVILAALRKNDVTRLERRLEVVRETVGLLNEGVSAQTASAKAGGFVAINEDFQIEKDFAKLQGDVEDLFKSGLKAAIEGDFEDFLAGKLQGAADKMFDNAIDILLNSLMSANGPLAGLFGGGSEGGLSGIIGAGGAGIAKAGGGKANIGGLFGGLAGIFAGFFADGGVVPKGQFAIVGEGGPEIISAGASPLRVTPMNDNVAASHAARLSPDGGGGARAFQYAPVNNFYGHTQDDLRRSLDARDSALKSEMPSLMDQHSFNRKRGMA